MPASTELAKRRKAVGLNQEKLAELVGVNRSTVVRWEAGATPYPRQLEPLARCLQVTVQQLHSLLANEPVKDTVMLGSHSSLLGLALVDPLAGPESPSEAMDSDAVLALLAQMSAVDNNAGPNSVLPVIESQQERVTDMLRASPTSSDAHYAASRFAEFRGWLHHDLGQLDLAMQWTSTALDLAMAGGCDQLAAYHWMRKSNIASDANQTQLAVAFARSSRGQQHVMTPRLRAVAQRQEAYAHALDRDEYECSALLDAAFESVGQGAAGEDLATYCSESYIEMESANAWIELGRHEDAIPILESADQDWSGEFRRDHGLCKARLSLAYAGNEQPADAIAKAKEGIDLARVTDSARSWHFLRRTAHQLKVVGAEHEAEELTSLLPIAS